MPSFSEEENYCNSFFWMAKMFFFYIVCNVYSNYFLLLDIFVSVEFNKKKKYNKTLSYVESASCGRWWLSGGRREWRCTEN